MPSTRCKCQRMKTDQSQTWNAKTFEGKATFSVSTDTEHMESLRQDFNREEILETLSLKLDALNIFGK